MIRQTQPKILIVNDSASELASLIAGLKLEGFSISGTTDAFSAADIIDRSHFDVILIDMMIPDVDGIALSKQISRKHPKTKTLLMSDYMLSPAQLTNSDTASVALIPRPCSFNELASYINEKLKAPSYTDADNYSPSQAPIDVLAIRY